MGLMGLLQTYYPEILAAVILAGFAYMYFESQWIEVTRKTLEFDNLPPTFDGFQILLVSDFHSRRIGWRERRALAMISRLDADVLIIAGDMKARNTTPNRPVINLLEALLATTKRFPFPPLYIRGNHDHRGFDELVGRRRDLLALYDRSIAVQRDGQRLFIAGVRRAARVTRRMRPSIRKALREIPSGSFTILLSHSPDFFRMAARRGVDLVLAGDSHGGQICLPFYGPLQSKSRLGRDCNRGLIEKFGGRMYVTRGVGTTGPSLRLLCRPEISVLTLKRRATR
jgi:uncharacterized protein